ncbi:hypothetical protein ABVG11_37855 [Streptomyces sp. HD1123-B1]|uniref:hypothetical protein n=1 Tax=Streptomyces huangiella TaxID=3228804 RepID=UPI003D7ED354
MRHKSTRYRASLAFAACGILATTVGCTSSEDERTDSGPQSGTSTGVPSAEPKPLNASELQKLLITPRDLGPGYAQDPAKESGSEDYDDTAIEGCSALEKLGKQGDQAQFAVKATADFTYNTDSELGEELYSDTSAALSTKLRTIMDAYASCPTYTMTAGSTPIEIKVSKSTPPQTGDEQYAHTTTLKLPSGPQVLKTAAVRQGNVVVMLTGTPALVDRHIETAVGKATASD